METRQSVKDIGPADNVQSIFLLGAASLQQSRNGPYWRLELRDATGCLEAKIWSPLSQQFTELPPGALAAVEGRSGTYRDQIQLTVDRLRLLSTEEQAACDLRDFLPAGPYNPRDMLEDMRALCRQEFTHAPWRRFALAVLDDETVVAGLLTAPAAKGVHHAYLGGLLEHSLSVGRLVLGMAGHYPELDRQTLLAGGVFHDLGKIRELSGGLCNDYTDEGRLLGHIALGLDILAPFLAKSRLDPQLIRHFRHLILSHHGSYEFGAPRLPQTPEALALHYADNLDAKMAQCRALFDGWTEDQTGWTPYQVTLGRFLHRPLHTPNPSDRLRKAPSPQENQCSFL